MKPRRAFSGLAAVLLLASALGVPQAAADPCRWVPHDLPLPAGATGGATVSSSGDNSLILGQVYVNGLTSGVVWWNGELWQMDPAPNAMSVLPKDINNSSLVVGRMVVHSGAELVERAFRFQYGRYELLPTEPGELSEAIAVNDAGDITGVVWQKGSANLRTVVVWPADGPRRSFAIGEPIGVSSDRKVVMTRRLGPETIWVADLAAGTETQLPTARTPMVLDNDRILHFAFTAAGTEIVELDLDGRRVTAYEGGIEPYGKTSSGTLFGTSGPGNTTLWQWNTRSNVDSEKLPKPAYYGDATDGGALIGTYENGTSRPARWFWCA